MSSIEHIESGNIRLAVQGLNCGNCQAKVARCLKDSGATKIEVSLEKCTATFSLDDHSLLSNVITNLKQIGFPAQLIEENTEKFDYFNIALTFCCLLTAPLMLHMFVSWHLLHNPYIQWILSTPVVVFCWYHFGVSAWHSLRSRHPNMDVLVVTGVTAAYCYSLLGVIYNLGPNYLFFETSASITCFVLIGNYLERKSLRSTTSALTELIKLQVVPARRIKKLGVGHQIEVVDASLIKSGEFLAINTGDRVPVDGQVTEGSFYVDESMLTGESKPILKEIGSSLYAGSLILEGAGSFLATNVGNSSMLGQMINLVREAQSTRPPIQRLGDLISSWFVPFVFIVALATFLLVFLVFNLGFQVALLRTIAVIVIACPCAMGLATPTAISVALGRAAKSGIFFKSSAILEALAKTKHIVFDKTGTLTSNLRVVKEQIFTNANPKYIRSLLYSLELRSTHPLAQALTDYYKSMELTTIEFSKYHEERGLGIRATTKAGNNVVLGSKKILTTALASQCTDVEDSIFLVEDDKLLCSIKLVESLKPDAVNIIALLHELNLSVYLLSGDSYQKVTSTAKQLQISSFYAEQSPQQKLDFITQLQQKNSVAYVGDGINDAPALSIAAVGIALADASQIALDSAQIVINQKDLTKVYDSIKLARVTLTTIKQNLFWAFFYNIAAIPLAALGYLTPMIAAIVMALSDVIVIGNSLRLKTKNLHNGK